MEEGGRGKMPHVGRRKGVKEELGGLEKGLGKF